MFKFFALVAAAFSLLGSAPALAGDSSAEAPHVHVRLVILPQELTRGADSAAGVYFSLEPGWHIYWRNAGDSGEPPHVRWRMPAGIVAGALQFPSPKRLPLGPLMDFGYEGEVLFPFSLKVGQNAALGPATMVAKVDWLVCRESCIPGKAFLEIQRKVVEQSEKLLPSAADASIFFDSSGKTPLPSTPDLKAGFLPTANGFRLTVVTGHRESEANFFPLDQDILSNPAPQKFAPMPKGFVLDLKKDASLTKPPMLLNGVLELSGGRSYEVAIAHGAPTTVKTPPPSPPEGPLQEEADAKGSQLPEAVASAPASALPPISVTPPARVTFLGSLALAFLGGMLLNLMPCVFPVLFLKGLALVRASGVKRRSLRLHGVAYSAGILVSFWILASLLMALRSAGMVLGWGFQFQSPTFLLLIASLLFFVGLSLAGQFEIGLTLTGAGSSLAAKKGYVGSVFTGVLAVVAATPCTAPFMGAALGYALAQTPAMALLIFTALALGLAAPYLALTLNPAWTRWLPKPGVWMEILRQAISVPIFATVIWLAWVLARAYGSALLVALLVNFLLLAIAGWFLGRWPAARWAAAIAGLIALTIFLGSVIAPDRLATAPESRVVAGADVWEPWSAEKVDRYLAQGRPVFVDFTASWCLTCQVNERVVLSRPEVRQAFAASHVALLRADWTRHDMAITQALSVLGRGGVPTYVFYKRPKLPPSLLPETLTPSIVFGVLQKP